MQDFDFAFDPWTRWPLALAGIRPATCRAVVSERHLDVKYGPWRLQTTLDNVREVTLTGPYRWYRAIGPRVSGVDRGLTFGTTVRGGVCVRFHEPVPGFLGRRLLHPGLTVTVADPAGFQQAVAPR